MAQNGDVVNGSPSKASNLTIEFPHISLAEDEGFTTALTELVNAGYSEAEAGIFKPGYLRTSASEIASFIKTGILVVASAPSPETTSKRIPLGCISIKKLAENRAELGLFAVAIEQRGSGIGRDLMDWAEKWCLDNCGGSGVAIAQLDLLVPTHFTHTFKVRLELWYTKRGYSLTGSRDFALDYPSLAPQLAGPTEYRVYEKTLV
ncbi:uncharacterized protein GGS22DRAFT_62764 [Annulohypoxylon maeteangense]|uniref:uncharacterized protein n=1 Tax=Annulohypoxylon maeteangense TaxID=1927788 RepID=UPI002007FBD0|nr:uncharacterized protein GGS22DRAFT_62764 [Annulohypoxylon maeteangense]KAI0888753.1 hypothetical protein GGS22DRAFT_62764 [Annulohypoxylon maeteangense]